MTNEKKIEIIKEVANVVSGDFEDNYSGRGMYGAECVGITCDDPDYCIEEAASRGIRNAKTDNMGRQYIVYWPSIRLETKPAETT